MEEESKLTKYILSPLLSGVYVSKSDLSAVALSCGFAIQLQERKRMLKELFALVQKTEDFVRIVDAFLSFMEYKAEQYKSIAGEYPSSAEVAAMFLDRIESAKVELGRAKEEAALIA
ncbi:MAG: hypothetical protein AB7D29_10185 [Campylobacterales bacterium]